MKTSDFFSHWGRCCRIEFRLESGGTRQGCSHYKGKFLDCSSAKAQGGIAAVWDRNDSFEDHVADTLDAGAGLCNEQAVRTIVEEGPDAIRELLEWGVNFDPGNQERIMNWPGRAATPNGASSTPKTQPDWKLPPNFWRRPSFTPTLNCWKTISPLT